MTRQNFVRNALVGLLMVALFPAAAQAEPARSLYERLGRYDGIAAIADDYLKLIRSDPQFTRFTGRGADSLKRGRQLLKDQLCALTGGPCTYPGRDMKTAHGGLAITEAEWAASNRFMSSALDSQKVAKKEKQEFLALIEGLKPMIVEKSDPPAK